MYLKQISLSLKLQLIGNIINKQTWFSYIQRQKSMGKMYLLGRNENFVNVWNEGNEK